MPYSIDSITTNGQETVQLHKFTVLVGANNSGKSQTLQDIHEYLRTGSLERAKLLQNVADQIPSLTEVESMISTRPHEQPGNNHISYVSSDLLSKHELVLQESFLASAYDGLNSDDLDTRSHSKRQLISYFGRAFVAHLGAEARFRLSAESPNFDPRRESPSNALQAFFQNRKIKQLQLRNAFRSAFDMDIGLDWAAMTTLYLRVHQDFGDIPDEQQLLDEVMKGKQSLSSQGDGYKSFAGVALSLLTFPERLLLLDEPEAFLHPAQARTLGAWIAQQAQTRTGQIIVASHSADFLAGAVSAIKGTGIVRLNRTPTRTIFHPIPSKTSQGLITSPLLSSQPVLDSLFHLGVVICEGDPDRAIYQTVAHKLLDDKRYENILFIHSNGKDAIKGPAQLLRDSGTPAAVIADFDLLSSEKTLEEVLKATSGKSLPDEMRLLRREVTNAIEALTESNLETIQRARTTDPIESGSNNASDSLIKLGEDVFSWLAEDHADLRDAQRALSKVARIATGKWNSAKKSGLNALDTATRTKAELLIEFLAQNRLFVVPSGELESWFDLGISKGSEWNRLALEKIHAKNCPKDLDLFVDRVCGSLVEAAR